MERIEDVRPEWTCVNAELFARLNYSVLADATLGPFIFTDSQSIEQVVYRESKFPPPHLFVWSSGNLQGRRIEGSPIKIGSDQAATGTRVGSRRPVPPSRKQSDIASRNPSAGGW